MAKIVIDTNEFIDMIKMKYEEVEDYIEKIKNNLDSYIFPQQIIDETIRNTLEEQNKLFKGIDSSFSPYEVKKCDKLSNKDFKKQIAVINKELKEVAQKEKSIISNKCNLIIDLFTQIEKENIIPTSQSIIDKATARKICGNPPKSAARIGDEIIWESLLSWKKEDIVIVSNDHTFFENFRFLQIEYSKTGKKLLHVCKKLNEAMQYIGKPKDSELKKLEEKEEKLTDKIINNTLHQLSFQKSTIDGLNKVYSSSTSILGDTLATYQTALNFAKSMSLNPTIEGLKIVPSSYIVSGKGINLATIDNLTPSIKTFSEITLPKSSKSDNDD